MSGVFAVTFSVIFAYVADITQEHERSTAYGLVRNCLGSVFKCVLHTYISISKWGLCHYSPSLTKIKNKVLKQMFKKKKTN